LRAASRLLSVPVHSLSTSSCVWSQYGKSCKVEVAIPSRYGYDLHETEHGTDSTGPRQASNIPSAGPHLLPLASPSATAQSSCPSPARHVLVQRLQNQPSIKERIQLLQSEAASLGPSVHQRALSERDEAEATHSNTKGSMAPAAFRLWLVMTWYCSHDRNAGDASHLSLGAMLCMLRDADMLSDEPVRGSKTTRLDIPWAIPKREATLLFESIIGARAGSVRAAIESKRIRKSDRIHAMYRALTYEEVIRLLGHMVRARDPAVRNILRLASRQDLERTSIPGSSELRQSLFGAALLPKQQQKSASNHSVLGRKTAIASLHSFDRVRLESAIAATIARGMEQMVQAVILRSCRSWNPQTI